MRVFLTGGTGVVGRRAIPLLVAAGHDVTAMVRSEEGAALVERLGAEPARVGLFDRAGLEGALAGHDAVVNLATSIPPVRRTLSRRAWAVNDRVRRLGSATLAEAALAAGVGRYVQESITFVYADGGDAWIDESWPVEVTPAIASALDAEAAAARVTAAGGTGVVLRFGAFYGPDSEHTLALLRLAKAGVDVLPGGDEDWVSCISTDDAAAAVVAALNAPAGTYNVVDDEPLRRREYDAILATAVGTRRVRRPALVRAAAARGAPHLARSQRVSNHRLREVTGWAPRHAGLADGLPATVAASGARPLPADAGLLRALLAFLAAGALVVGAWAQFAPTSFYTSFPGGGRAWVSVDGPFNEHLVRDVGGLNLALGVLTLVAAAGLSTAMVRTAAAAWLAYGLPHLGYHAAHLAPLQPADRVANVVSLAAVVVAAAVLLGRAGRTRARPAAMAPGRGLDPRFQASKARVLPIGRPRNDPGAPGGGHVERVADGRAAATSVLHPPEGVIRRR